ncbi:MAG: TrkH family potassium uptake protein [Ruminococcaceae bacterium]|nr:TrkH family potassium uptake protein [Oscillospiraceae bacterium]
MNGSIIRYILGQVLKIEGAFMAIPIITAVCYGEFEGFYYVAVSAVCLILGILMTLKKPKSNTFYLKEGCITTSLCWIFLSFFGCLPFIFSGEIPSFTDAVFETVSGFTTTGASILSNVEALSHCSLLWRSFTHWIGGMGVLVFLLAIVPLNGGSHINLMRAESPGPVVGKLVPKLRHTARILYIIYLILTVIQFILLVAGKMPVFDALSTTFGTAGTGGFGIKTDSIGGYSPYIQWVVTVFMLLFGVNFNAYYFILYRHFKKAFSMEEVRAYFIIVVTAVGIIMVDVVNRFSSFWEALRHSAFQVASIITTTGYTTTDFNAWSQTSRLIIVMLMFVGACAGSTGGGIKVSRFVVVVKTVFKELGSYIHPKSIRKIKFDGKPVEHDVVRSINVYFITFIIIFGISIFLVSLEGKDLVTSFTAVSATINNIGPGLEGVGPTGNFGGLSNLSKWVLIFDMLAGRLELFPLLLLFHPAAWRDMFSRKRQ